MPAPKLLKEHAATVPFDEHPSPALEPTEPFVSITTLAVPEVGGLINVSFFRPLLHFLGSSRLSPPPGNTPLLYLWFDSYSSQNSAT